MGEFLASGYQALLLNLSNIYAITACDNYNFDGSIWWGRYTAQTSPSNQEFQSIELPWVNSVICESFL